MRLTEPAGSKVRALIARDDQGEYLRIAITGGYRLAMLISI